MLDFKEFRGRATPTVNEPMATVQKGGKSISLNRAAYELIGDPSHVVLLYDEKRQVIGMRPSDGDVRWAYPVKKQGRSVSYLVSSTAFTTMHKIDVSIARRFAATLYEGMLIIDLTQPVAELTGPRTAAQSLFGKSSPTLPSLER